MAMCRLNRRRRTVSEVARILIPALLLSVFSAPSIAGEQFTDGTADIGQGVVLHYMEAGHGVPVVFVHGSLGDMTYWNDQVAAFSDQYRAIAYSRRYNAPNENPAVRGYSAITDAEDLARFIRVLDLHRVYIVGHSYGAFTGLVLAIRHPELIRAIVLAEPPDISLLLHLSGADRDSGRALYADIQRRMVGPMRQAFLESEREAGVATFINYVLDDPHAWDKLSAASQGETLRDAHEWDIMLTTGTLFPFVSPDSIRKIDVPVLIMSGGRSYRFLGLIDRELTRLIPGATEVVYPDAGHQMWLQHPRECREAAEAFFRSHD
jgi:non-heme chloroperoxidase